jgi:hypothetical protein
MFEIMKFQLKKAASWLVLAFLVVFLIQSPNEAAELVKVTGEQAGEWFSTASNAFADFLRSLI